jgi:hypothetical protein
MRRIALAAVLFMAVPGCAAVNGGNENCALGLLQMILNPILDPEPKDDGTRQSKVKIWEWENSHPPSS